MTGPPTAAAPPIYEQNLRRVAELRLDAERRNQRHGIPALLSFFIPGLGQLVKGQFLKGVGVFVGTGISIALIYMMIGIVTTPLLWIWQLYDAYRRQTRGGARGFLPASIAGVNRFDSARKTLPWFPYESPASWTTAASDFRISSPRIVL
jgi:TM2 domain-containing membrane protein YozV